MKFGLTLAAAALAAVSAMAADKIQSSHPVGGSMTPFDVVDVSGPNKGKQLCYV